MTPDSAGLSRFVDAQDATYASALAEIRAGAKRSHWIWFVFPQLRGLGRSPTSQRYGIADMDEARAYLAHPVLGARLRESTEALLTHDSATAVLGDLDAMKFRSSLTLFQQAAPDDAVFAIALQRFFDGEPDPLTVQLLETRSI